MKTWILFITVLAVSVFAFDNSSWAMGKKGRGSSGSRFTGSSGSSSPVQVAEDNLGAGDQQTTFSLEPLVKEVKPETPNTPETKPVAAQTAVPAQEGVQPVAEGEDFPSSATVPEPATLTLMGLGMAGLWFSRNRR